LDRKNLGAGPIEFYWRLDQWFPELGAEKLGKLKIVYDEFLKANKALNLVSVKTLTMSDAIHFSDSVIASRLIYNSGKFSEIHDFSGGNGFPSTVFAVLFPDVLVKVVEPDERKCDYMRHISIVCKLKNIEVVKSSMATLPDKSVKYAMSRGFAPISKAILGARKCFQKEGVYFHIKGEEWAREVADIPSQLCSFWLPHLLGEYKLPVGAVKFAVVATKKIAD
jgi:16S rRNA (guanine527-N7)-methyltransferase